VSFFPRSVYVGRSVFFSNYILSSVHLFKLQYRSSIKTGECRTNNTVTQATMRPNFSPLFPLATRRRDLYFSFLSYHTIFSSNKTKTTQFRIPQPEGIQQRHHRFCYFNSQRLENFYFLIGLVDFPVD
jgi:hypothetical protein